MNVVKSANSNWKSYKMSSGRQTSSSSFVLPATFLNRLFNSPEVLQGQDVLLQLQLLVVSPDCTVDSPSSLPWLSCFQRFQRWVAAKVVLLHTAVTSFFNAAVHPDGGAKATRLHHQCVSSQRPQALHPLHQQDGDVESHSVTLLNQHHSLTSAPSAAHRGDKENGVNGSCMCSLPTSPPLFFTVQINLGACRYYYFI